jgi:D-serine deaminase-like pyridoxal phosphate-dependent protein
MSHKNDWYRIRNEEEVFSPALMVYPDRIESNIRKMILTAGDLSRLRPHVKTHKMAEVVKLQMKQGIYKFKCATISEAEMIAACGAEDILLAMQPVGPNLKRFFSLKLKYRNANISCIADSEKVIRQLSELASLFKLDCSIWLDINNGMNRTGIVPGKEAKILYRLTDTLPGMKAAGLHVYDGQIHEKDLRLRQQICDEAFAPVNKMKKDLIDSGSGPVNIVAGGTPTFPIHAFRRDVETSPGTILLWDYGYSTTFSDLDFLHAAVLLTRVVSKPGKDLLCLDLGHKAVGSEMPQPRIKIMGMDDYTITGHNEEHMVVRSPNAQNMNPGDPVYAIPWHICPTVDRHDTVCVVEDERVTGQWSVDARKRKITI